MTEYISPKVDPPEMVSAKLAFDFGIEYTPLLCDCGWPLCSAGAVHFCRNSECIRKQIEYGLKLTKWFFDKK